MSYRVFVPSLIFGVFAVLSVGCGNGDSKAGPVPGESQISDSKETPAVKQPPASGKVVKVTPRAFYDECRADQQAAKAKYTGVTIEMSGQVAQVFQDLTDPGVYEPFIMLKTEAKSGEKVSHDYLLCKTIEPKPWFKAAPEGSITLRGRLRESALAFAPGLEDCEIVSYDGGVGIEVKPEDLAKAYIADTTGKKEIFYEKYHGKPLVIAGVVESRFEETNAGITIKCGDGAKLAFTYGAIDKDAFKHLKPGDPVQGIFGISRSYRDPITSDTIDLFLISTLH